MIRRIRVLRKMTNTAVITVTSAEGITNELLCSPTSSHIDNIDVSQDDNISTSRLLTKYHLACQNGQLEIVEELVRTKKIDVHHDYHSSSKMTGLHWATLNNRFNVVAFLVKEAINIDSKTSENYRLPNMTPIQIACKYGYVYIVHYFLKNNANPLVLDNDGSNLLQLAVSSSNVMNVLYVLFFVNDIHNISVDSKNKNGRTALHSAVLQEDIATVKILIKYGADLLIEDFNGYCSLKYAAIKGNRELNEVITKYMTSNDIKIGELSNCLPNVISMYSSSKSFIKNTTVIKQLIFMLPSLPIIIFTMVAKYNVVIGLVVFSIFSKLLNSLLCYILLPAIPYDRNIRKAFLKSPVLAGLLFASLNMVTFIWFYGISEFTSGRYSFINILFPIAMFSTYCLFFKLISSDPGKIPKETNSETIRSTINSLILEGKFSSHYFCLETSVRKPLRSKFSDISQCQVARFDHYCSWLNNDIGLKNHKMFIFFIFSLEVSLSLFITLSFGYFKQKESISWFGSYCSWKTLFMNDGGASYDGIIGVLLIMSIYLALFTSSVLIQQFYEISKGLTCLEMKQLLNLERSNNLLYPKAFIQNDYYNVRKQDLYLLNDGKYTETHNSYGTVTNKLISSEYSKLISRIATRRLLDNRRYNKDKRDIILRFLGFDMWKLITQCSQDIKTYQDCDLPNGLLEPTKNTSFTNMKDFWLTSELRRNLLNRFIHSTTNSEALLNGTIVDYYNLWEFPIGKCVPLTTDTANLGSKLV